MNRYTLRYATRERSSDAELLQDNHDAGNRTDNMKRGIDEKTNRWMDRWTGKKNDRVDHRSALRLSQLISELRFFCCPGTGSSSMCSGMTTLDLRCDWRTLSARAVLDDNPARSRELEL